MNTVQRYRMLLVATATELADRVNSAVRASGTSIDVLRVGAADDAAGKLAGGDFDLLACEAGGSGTDYSGVHAAANGLPVIALASRPGNSDPAAVLAAGLDAIAYVDLPGHLDAVIRREVGLHQRLRHAESAARDTQGEQRELQQLFELSSDALAVCEAGILIECNDAWRDLFGAAQSGEGGSVLECFADTNTSRLKQALRGDREQELEVAARSPEVGAFAAQLMVRNIDPPRQLLLVRSNGRASQLAELQHQSALDTDTGLLTRQRFLQVLAAEADASLALVRVDGFTEIVQRIGNQGADAAIRQLAQLVQERLEPGQSAARMDGTTIGILLPAAKPAAAESWAESVRDAVTRSIFEHGSHSTSLTVSIGIRHGLHSRTKPVLDEAWNALHEARKQGNSVVTYLDAEEQSDAERKAEDKQWAVRIHKAVKQNGFRLAYQKVTELAGEDDAGSTLFDVLLRLQNEHGEDSLPGEFMPAAERAGQTLMIDRWVINEALRVLKKPGNPGRESSFFVRLTEASFQDENLRTWLGRLLADRPEGTGKLIIEVSDRQAESHLKQIATLSKMLNERECSMLLSFTVFDEGSVQLMEHLALDFIKLDARFIAKATDAERETLKGTIAAAAGRGIHTIASNIEDANTMAQLWQLGVTHVQGYYLQEPEVVISADDDPEAGA